MQGGPMPLKEPIRPASILTSVKPKFLSSLTKIVGALGPKSHSVGVIESCLKAGMSVARFDFTCADEKQHQETLENLKTVVKNVNKLCVVMLDTKGLELLVYNKSLHPIELKVDNRVTLTPDVSKEPSSDVLLVNYVELSKIVIKGTTNSLMHCDIFDEKWGSKPIVTMIVVLICKTRRIWNRCRVGIGFVETVDFIEIANRCVRNYQYICVLYLKT